MAFFGNIGNAIGGALQNIERTAVDTLTKQAGDLGGKVVAEIANKPAVKTAVNKLSQSASTPLTAKLTPYIAIGVVVILVGGWFIVREAKRK